MNPLLKKLNFKNQESITILNSPVSFSEEMNDFKNYLGLNQEISSKKIEFILIFVTKQEEIDNLIPEIVGRIEEDGLLWMVYPKGTSKKYKCDFNRDTGWAILGKYGYEPVRMVAVDEDWSALRFRKAEFIKTLTRNENHILSEKGKEKAKKP